MKNKYKTQNPGILRRDFIKTATMGGLALSLVPNITFGQKGKNDKVHIGFIGVGGRGRSHLRNILKRDEGESPSLSTTITNNLKKREH